MTLALILFMATLILRELTFTHERKRWETERKDLYSRIQAGTLQEYIQTTKDPSEPYVKTREQRVSEEAEEKGIMRQDLQYPSHWKG